MQTLGSLRTSSWPVAASWILTVPLLPGWPLPLPLPPAAACATGASSIRAAAVGTATRERAAVERMCMRVPSG
ncbi:hypothetical protein HS99_0029880 [Kitasatospora aureofaciens]|uniref:Uncharacterized protein n=1 Tax=Kitasatospora aureofaciens TaxID=1894 RepID=A0A1E7N6Q2_KITAU|nr:hypothetical protein HS99_0029880 [Kitasatospora aureofaciens]